MQWAGSIGLVRPGHSCHPDSQKKAPMKEPFLYLERVMRIELTTLTLAT